MEWIKYKNIIYTVACITVLLECVVAEWILQSWFVSILALIVNFNFIYVLWKVNRSEEE